MKFGVACDKAEQRIGVVKQQDEYCGLRKNAQQNSKYDDTIGKNSRG